MGFNPLGANLTKWSNILKQFVAIYHTVMLDYFTWICENNFRVPTQGTQPNSSQFTLFQVNIRFLYVLKTIEVFSFSEGVKWQHSDIG